jgi:cytochrome c-type biogenesis protein CcmF
VRANQVSRGGTFALVSRETFLLVGNVFFVVAASAVLLGTVYPLVMDALNLGKLSVGAPYFNTVFVPIMVPVLVLLGVGPMANWKQANLKQLFKKVWGAAVLALIAPVVAYVWLGGGSVMTLVGITLAVWVSGSVVMQVFKRLKTSNPPLSYWGMQVAHMGMAVFVFGVTMVGGYQQEKDVRMDLGDVTTVGGYEFQFNGVQIVNGPNYEASRGEFKVSKPGMSDLTMNPEKRRYFSSAMPMTEAAIDAGLTRDLYVSLGEMQDNSAWSVRVFYKPFVDWIWGGCLMMALGGILAMFDRRYRRQQGSAAA